jgi:hypothetical protein
VYWSCSGIKQQPPQQSFVRVEGRQIVTPDGKPIRLRGINLGNWLLPEGYMFKLEVATARWQIQQVIKELVGPAEARWHFGNNITTTTSRATMFVISSNLE